MKNFSIVFLLTTTLFANDFSFPFSIGISKLGGVSREQTDQGIYGLKTGIGIAKFTQPSVIVSDQAEFILGASFYGFGTYRLTDKFAVRKILWGPMLYVGGNLGLNYQKNTRQLPDDCGFLSYDCGESSRLVGGFEDRALYASAGTDFGFQVTHHTSIDFNLSYPVFVFMHDNQQTVHSVEGWDDGRILPVPKYDSEEKKELTASAALTFGW